MEPRYLPLEHGNRIAYHQHKTTQNAHLPTILFLGGFMSDMDGTKATALHAYCAEKAYNFVRFDYFGHGASSQQFTDGTIGSWTENALAVLDQLTQGPCILVGSSMGGWIMLLVALQRKTRIAGLVGIAAAPDFTENLIWELLPESAKTALLAKGVYDLASEYNAAPYPITLKLIEEGRNHLLLHQAIPLSCPIRLIHGMKDDDVPYSLSLQLMERLTSTDARLTLVKQGDHRMSTPLDISLLCKTLEEMLAIYTEKE